MTAVQTQGWPGGVGYVTVYRLEISADCVTFHPIMDALNNNAVFLGYMIIEAFLYCQFYGRLTNMYSNL